MRNATNSSVVAASWVRLDVSAQVLESHASILTADELRRAETFRFARDRSRFIVRRGRLRQLLAHRLQCEPRDVVLSYNSFGKPFVSSSDLHFSVSHSGNLALFVMVEGLDIGCDIEWRRRQFANVEAAEMFFSPTEVEMLKALPSSQWTEAFFNCWTRKEAFVKGVGFGLSYPLDSFAVTVAPGGPAAFLMGVSGWTLQAFNPYPGLHVAVAGAAEEWTLDSASFGEENAPR